MKLQDASLPIITPGKAAYATPSLRRLGGLAALTASGSAALVEQGNPSNCSQDARSQCR